MADRNKPDFDNSVKESICAVEALCQKITGKKEAPLGECIKDLRNMKLLNAHLLNALEKIYIYTNKIGGARHAHNEQDQEITKSDARFMLVTCSAFINYLQSSIQLRGK